MKSNLSKMLLSVVALGNIAVLAYFIHFIKSPNIHGRQLASIGSDGTVLAEGEPGEANKGPTEVVVSLGEILVNVSSKENESHFLKLNLDVELFDGINVAQVAERKTALVNLVIELLGQQEYGSLMSLHGKLYFKEALTARLNEYLQAPAIRRAHFTSFFLQ